jgi:NADPH2:quinone reductase
MRAIVIREGGGPEVLRLEEVPDPEPGEGQVLVRVEAAAVNHFDLTQRRDPAATGASPPFTPGLDAAGTRVDTGERVLVSGAPGAYAELLAAPVENVRPIPDSLESARAAALGVAYKTAWGSLADGELERGDTLLVQAGSSGTGQAAIDIGRHLGADRLRDRERV